MFGRLLRGQTLSQGCASFLSELIIPCVPSTTLRKGGSAKNWGLAPTDTHKGPRPYTTPPLSLRPSIFGRTHSHYCYLYVRRSAGRLHQISYDNICQTETITSLPVIACVALSPITYTVRPSCINGHA